ncbi:uncharacterized protein C9orf85 homolog isoform X2 [Symphalangus syndactylus]|uniref:uncharacterized protein C9orf85 homolog isoform X2 n=1 Tax=Symphalangus syndactylus TaxID=9590 RepID=UPI0030046390
MCCNTAKVCSFTPEASETTSPPGGTNNSRGAALRAVTLTAKVCSFIPEPARPQTHQKEETPSTSEHQKSQTPDTPPLRTVTLTARVRGFILEVSETKNPPMPDTVASLVFSDLGFLASPIPRNGILGHVVSVIALLEAVGHRRELWNPVTSVQLY